MHPRDEPDQRAQERARLQVARLLQFLRELVAGHFYGTVTITFHLGQIGTIAKHETFTADALPVTNADAVRTTDLG